MASKAAGIRTGIGEEIVPVLPVALLGLQLQELFILHTASLSTHSPRFYHMNFDDLGS